MSNETRLVRYEPYFVEGGVVQFRRDKAGEWMKFSTGRKLEIQCGELAAALRDTLAALDIAYEFDGDVFGVHHNNTQDAMDTARAALEELK